MKKRRLVLRSNGESFFSSNGMLANQGWERLSWLLPVFAPRLLRPILHDLSREIRAWWPLWCVYGVSGGLLGVVWASGDELIRREIMLVRKGATDENIINKKSIESD